MKSNFIFTGTIIPDLLESIDAEEKVRNNYPSRIARRADITYSMTAHHIKYLQSIGLIKMAKDQYDNKRKMFELTEKGKLILLEIKKIRILLKI